MNEHVFTEIEIDSPDGKDKIESYVALDPEVIAIGALARQHFFEASYDALALQIMYVSEIILIQADEKIAKALVEESFSWRAVYSRLYEMLERISVIQHHDIDGGHRSYQDRLRMQLWSLLCKEPDNRLGKYFREVNDPYGVLPRNAILPLQEIDLFGYDVSVTLYNYIYDNHEAASFAARHFTSPLAIQSFIEIGITPEEAIAFINAGYDDPKTIEDLFVAGVDAHLASELIA